MKWVTEKFHVLEDVDGSEILRLTFKDEMGFIHLRINPGHDSVRLDRERAKELADGLLEYVNSSHKARFGFVDDD